MDPLNRHCSLIKTPFQTFEITITSYVRKTSSIPRLTLLKASNLMVNIMLQGKYQVGKGFGVQLQGMKISLKLKDNVSRFGLGYKPTHKHYLRMQDERKEDKITYLQNHYPISKRIEILHIRVSFPIFTGVKRSKE